MSLKNSVDIQRYSKGDVIISEGIISNNAYIVMAGTVQVTKKIENKTVVVSKLKEGDVFGEMGLISQSVRSANITAMEDVTIGIIDRENFEKQLDEISPDLRSIVLALVERLRFTTEQLSNIGIQLQKTRDAIQSYTLKQ